MTRNRDPQTVVAYKGHTTTTNRLEIHEDFTISKISPFQNTK